MKILISAYACEPGEGSEPGAGWHFAQAAAVDHDVTVLTRANNRPAVEAVLRDRSSGLRFEYLDVPWALKWKRGRRGVRLYYVLWQYAAARRAAELHARQQFDVLHHVTFAADWLPVGVEALADQVPLVWGPVGGATSTPWRLIRWLTPRGILQEFTRTVLGAVGRRVWGLRAGRRAGVTLAVNSDVAKWFGRHGIEAPVEQNVVVPSSQATRRAGRRQIATSERRTAVFAGRLEGWKGLLLAIEAISRTRGWQLEIYGSGPDRRAAERLARRRGIEGRVLLRGWVPLAEVHSAIRQADAFLLPSMHDSGPFAVAEAITLGCPVVCLDRGGPADMVSDGRGVAVSAKAHDVPAELARALDSAGVMSPNIDIGCWSPERLPGLLSRYYRQAVSGRSHSRLPPSGRR